MSTANTSPAMKPTPLSAQVPVELLGARLDQAASTLFPDYSRGRLQSWIKAGALTVNGRTGRAKQKVAGGEWLELLPEEEPQGEWLPEALPLAVLYEDEDILVLDKAPGMVVHPAAGNPDGTLLNALLHHRPELANLPRGGIVHRLDKDTSGLMVVAGSALAHQSLVAQLQSRSMGRRYEAIAQGRPPPEGCVEAAIGRHPQQRKKMAVVERGGKEAVTYFQVARFFSNFSHLHLKLATGRTHQIRVHMAHIGHPLAGDATYGGRRLPKSTSAELRAAVEKLGRQALHARQLTLQHPRSGATLSWQAPAPDDFAQLLQVLQEEEG